MGFLGSGPPVGLRASHSLIRQLLSFTLRPLPSPHPCNHHHGNVVTKVEKFRRKLLKRSCRGHVVVMLLNPADFHVSPYEPFGSASWRSVFCLRTRQRGIDEAIRQLLCYLAREDCAIPRTKYFAFTFQIIAAGPFALPSLMQKLGAQFPTKAVSSISI
jgi:hypothetical protein